MSRYQFRHGRTLDALELRGAVVKRASQARVGDTVCFLPPEHDFVIEAIEDGALGRLLFRSRNHTLTSFYDRDELIYVIGQ